MGTSPRTPPPHLPPQRRHQHPSVFVIYHDKALAKKTPILRANGTTSEHDCHLLDQLGYAAAASGGLTANTGLEQEIFLVDREEYFCRPDLHFTGRIIMCKLHARDQELCDHYMAPLTTWLSSA